MQSIVLARGTRTSSRVGKRLLCIGAHSGTGSRNSYSVFYSEGFQPLRSQPTWAAFSGEPWGPLADRPGSCLRQGL